MASFFIILFLMLLAWFWLNSIRVKEIAMQASANACKQIQAQFLDQTASLEKISLTRNKKGRLTLQRVYSFDFSRDRENRQKGHVSLIGQQVTQVILDDESGMTIL
jgi:hypothetical protein